jgi:hypothetical protein
MSRAVYFDSWKAAHPPSTCQSTICLRTVCLVDYNERRYLEDDRHDYPLFFCIMSDVLCGALCMRNDTFIFSTTTAPAGRRPTWQQSHQACPPFP